jgi:hypothetical protein
MRPAGLTQDDEDALREATLRQMFARYGTQTYPVKLYCIRFEHRADPSPAFLARFASSSVPVHAGSECDETPAGVFFHTVRGIAFRIDGIDWTDRDHATVQGGYFGHSRGGSANVYTLERRSGAWVVTKDVVKSLS